MPTHQEGLAQVLAQLKALCTTLSSGAGDSTEEAQLLTSLAASYDSTLATMVTLFSALAAGNVDTSSGLFSREMWDRTLAEVGRRAIARVELSAGNPKVVCEGIAIVKKKEESLRTVLDAVVWNRD